MDIHAGQQRPFPALAIVTVLFLLCITPGQLLLSKLFPEISGIVGINPSLVFLDIPTPLPVTIDLILVPGLLLLIYPLLILCYPSRTGMPSWKQAIQGAGSLIGGLLAVLFCMLSGGFIYYWVQDYLPRQARNAIGSFGINADIYLPYPGYETIHLRGSMVLLVCFVIGMTICIRKIRKVPGMQKTTRLTREQRMTPYERMLRETQMMQQPAIKQKRRDESNSRQTITPDGSLHKQAPPVIQSVTNRKPAIIMPRTNQSTAQGAILPATQRTIQPDRKDPPGLCRRQPVTTIEPAAVNYMPMS